MDSMQQINSKTQNIKKNTIRNKSQSITKNKK